MDATAGERAAILAHCSDEHGQLRAVHDLLFKAADATPTLQMVSDSLPDFGGAEVLDCVQSQETRRRVAGDIEAARTLGVVGTPSAAYNGQLWEGIDAVWNLLQHDE